MPDKESPFACEMSAIAAEQRAAHFANIEQLFRSVESIHELPDGYTFQLPNQPEVLLAATQFITLERLCCPFFGFALEIEPEGGDLRLSLTGRDGVKSFIMAEIGNHVPVKIQSKMAPSERHNLSTQLPL